MNRHYQYLIIGGGIAADAAVRGIRDVDAQGTVGLISADMDPPYRRPWLSKNLWRGESIDKVWLKTANRGAEVILGRRVEHLDPERNQVFDAGGDSYTYGRLLLATGVRPRTLAPESDRILSFHSLADYRRLAEQSGVGQRIAVVGSGFIGSELAAALTSAGSDVHLISPDATIGARMFPAGLAEFITDRYRHEGVELHLRSKVKRVVESESGVRIDLIDLDGEPAGYLDVDVVVAGIGSVPNDELASSAGLRTEDGIVVDSVLRTSQADIFSAGDVARFFQPALGKLVRVEHEDNARKMGRAAGRAMAGQPAPYDYLPFFYSDLFDMGYEAVGEIDSRLEMIEDWSEPYVKGIVTYAEDDRVRGVLLWNVWDNVDAARQLIGAKPNMRSALLG